MSYEDPISIIEKLGRGLGEDGIFHGIKAFMAVRKIDVEEGKTWPHMTVHDERPFGS